MRTGLSARVAGTLKIAEILRATGTCKPSGDNESQKIWICIAIFCWMGGYKHIEKSIGTYIAAHIPRWRQVWVRIVMPRRSLTPQGSGAGLSMSGLLCTRTGCAFPLMTFSNLTFRRYAGADVIYAIRPAEEMISPLIALAQRVNCDLLVYHLGFESRRQRGERIDCGVLLHRYHRYQNPSKSVD